MTSRVMSRDLRQNAVLGEQRHQHHLAERLG